MIDLDRPAKAGKVSHRFGLERVQDLRLGLTARKAYRLKANSL
jgi:hypothetical protein